MKNPSNINKNKYRCTLTNTLQDNSYDFADMDTCQFGDDLARSLDSLY